MSQSQDDDTIDEAALRVKYVGTTYVPVLVDGDDTRTRSKAGGTPWLAHGESWPACGGCTLPMKFVMQLARDEVPASARWAFERELIQLFLCEGQGKPGDPKWICQSELDGWLPFAACVLVRHVDCNGAPAEVRDALSLEWLDVRRRVGLETMVDHCKVVGDPAGARSYARSIDSERVDPRIYVVPASREQCLQDRSFLFPARRIADWSEEIDVPAYGDVDRKTLHAIHTRLKLKCRYGDKLGGFPRWSQDPIRARCERCGVAMRPFYQLTSGMLTPVNVGGGASGWIFVCPTCKDATFAWQR